MIVETIAGVVLAAVSLALVFLARVQMGKAFAVTPKANYLVTHGLYSRLQHPMYVFVDLTVCGIALAVQRWYVLLPLAVLVPLQIRNARGERKLLQEKFGERSEAYRRGTWLSSAGARHCLTQEEPRSAQMKKPAALAEVRPAFALACLDLACLNGEVQGVPATIHQQESRPTAGIVHGAVEIGHARHPPAVHFLDHVTLAKPRLRG